MEEPETSSELRQRKGSAFTSSEDSIDSMDKYSSLRSTNLHFSEDTDSLASLESASESDEWDAVLQNKATTIRWQIIGVYIQNTSYIIPGDFPLPGDKPTFAEYKDEFLKWLGPLSYVKDDILSGIGVTLTLVPEVKIASPWN